MLGNMPNDAFVQELNQHLVLKIDKDRFPLGGFWTYKQRCWLATFLSSNEEIWKHDVERHSGSSSFIAGLANAYHEALPNVNVLWVRGNRKSAYWNAEAKQTTIYVPIPDDTLRSYLTSNRPVAIFIEAKDLTLTHLCVSSTKTTIPQSVFMCFHPANLSVFYLMLYFLRRQKREGREIIPLASLKICLEFLYLPYPMPPEPAQTLPTWNTMELVHQLQ